ncbi:ABC transporter ATP-binding protein/permease [Candidatus Parcubacteria bacterium]|nr:ABC transporter ATP-binding protein/permease [Candidatus Parcubacteria bacterium]
MLLAKELDKFKLIIRLSKQAFGKYKLQIIILTVLGFFSGLLGGIGINAIIPLFSFIVGDGQGSDDLISKYIEQFFAYLNIDFTLKYILIFIVLSFLFKTLVLILFSYISVLITSGYEKQARNDLLETTMKAAWPYLLKQRLGHLETILLVNVQYSKALLSQISTTIMTLTNLAVYTLIAVNISFSITVITFALGGVLFLFLKPLVYRIRKISYEQEEINRKISHFINENIVGLKTIKIMSVGDKIFNIGEQYFDKIRHINIKSHILSIFSSSLIEPISIIFIAVIFAISYKILDFNIAALMAVLYLTKQIFIYITNLQQQLIGMNATVPYLKKVLDYEAQASVNKEKNTGKDHFKFDQSLQFKDVCFNYNSEQEILSKVDFEIKRGALVGLIGSSGAGKTTVVDLILRLFNPDSGRILLDGKDISGINIEEWRENIGYVSQDIFLMNDTVANNIKFYNDSLTQKDIEEAAKITNIYDFIMSSPKGFDAVVGERGVMLSGGQRQRLIIARILARKPKLLILDEATSALDNESEVKIQQVIEKLKGKITVLAIAHRLSTVINSDKLIILGNGKISEQGSPGDLLKDKNSYFFKNYNIRNN